MEEVTATQAAALTGLSERTIRRRIAAGKLSARRIAPNRFAIRVQDLPRRLGVGDLAARVEALEHRMSLLELRLGASGEAASAHTPAAVGDTALMPLRELLAQLAHEAERLGPLLAPAQPEEAIHQPDAMADGRRRGESSSRSSHAAKGGDAKSAGA
jgi:hypothetical protein